MQDGIIAAGAVVHRLTVATRNVRDFEVFGVDTLDPFAKSVGGRFALNLRLRASPRLAVSR